MTKITVLILMNISIFVLLSFSCKDVGVQPFDKTFALTVDDASCTEVWLRIKLGQGNTNREVTLKRDTITLFTKNIDVAEMVITDTNLAPYHTYTYTASLPNSSLASSSTARTLDTTSHNFTWQTFTFGDPSAGSSILNDIAVVSENDIWAVGEIYITDTSTNGFTTYNAVHWNGNNWEQLVVPYYYQGQSYFHPIISVFNFGTNDIWFCGNGIIHMEGRQFNPIPIPSTVWEQDQINKMWGISSSNFYIVGNSGSIAHYQNGQWSKLESGTDLPFQDIWGNGGEILAIASDKFGFGGQYLVTIAGNTVKQIPTNIQTASSFSSIWFQSNRKYFLAGNGVYTKHNLSDAQWQVDPISQPLETYFYSIRGSSLNNIVTVGEGSYIAHFNGVTWKVYNDLRNPPDRLSSVAVTENMIVAVGYKYVSGIEVYGLIYIGRR